MKETFVALFVLASVFMTALVWRLVWVASDERLIPKQPDIAPARKPAMRKVVIESPLRGNVDMNTNYAEACLLDCLRRGESPLASHLLLTRVLDDANDDERALGIGAGHAWIAVADAVVVYGDLGISSGMTAGMSVARSANVPIEYRSLSGWEKS